MFLNTNMKALKAYGNLKRSNSKLSKTLEKLSSGYTINRAGDDAAGLAISEKMRALITGLERAKANTQEGINLIDVGEGALQEVHSMLDRLKYLATQSANGTYQDEVDRENLQAELEQICAEIDRIAKFANFNGVALFQDDGLEYESGTAPTTTLTLDDVLSEKSDTLKNIIYTETTFDFETTQTSTGSATNKTEWTGAQALADELQTTIVPQVVQAITNVYGDAFSYLNGSSIGIGLNLYCDSTGSKKDVLASVSSGVEIKNGKQFMTYKLSVNVASLLDGNNGIKDLDDAANLATRNALEQTIAHEMIHAFMDEATTSGMFGMKTDGTSTDKFPMWFIEGMAQTASGPGNWILASGGLGLSATSSESAIQAALSKYKTSLSSSSSQTAAQYGTGYLACMYLGYLASGANADMSDRTESATKIASGVSDILEQLKDGYSLQRVISKVTNGKYTTISEFETKFASDADAQTFIKSLLKYVTTAGTSNGSDGTNVGGGLLSGDLTSNNPVADTEITGLKLFALNTDNSIIKNEYPSDITVISGGSATANGVNPNGTRPTLSTNNPFTITTASGSAATAGATQGTGDYWFDTTTGILHIYKDGLTISGGFDAANGDYGSIKIAKSVTDVTLNNVTIDAKQLNTNQAGIEIEENANVTIHITGTNTVTGSGTAAGIQLTDDNENDGTSTLTIDMQGGTLTANGDKSVEYGGAGIGGAAQTANSASNINITGYGTLKAYGGSGSAAIGGGGGASYAYTIHDISINGTENNGDVLTIQAEGGYHGAGIGGGWNTNMGDITITGYVDIKADSDGHAAGIGGGCGAGGVGGKCGAITIGKTDGSDSNSIKIYAKGGEDGAGIGVGWLGKGTSVVINGGDITAIGGNNGAGIGAGLNATLKDLTIQGGTIHATGGNDGAGIGAGSGATITDITIENGNITAQGGNSGAGIGVGYNANGGSLTINDGKINATAGRNGAGIGSGYKGSIGTITINDGDITAKGDTDSAGIGGGRDGSVAGVIIKGGIITADGGWTNDGGNIGGFTDKTGKNQASVTIDPTKSSIKVGDAHNGEGKWGIDSTPEGGAKDGAGNILYSFNLSYIDKLLGQNPRSDKLKVTDEGATAGLNFPVTVTMKVANDPTQTQTWTGWQHGSAQEGYIWMKPQDVTLEFTDADGTSGSVDLTFFEKYDGGNYCVWRVDAKDLPDKPFTKPGYSDAPVPDPDPEPTPNPTPTPTPTPKPEPNPPEEEETAAQCGIILQVGANVGDTFTIPRFYFSYKALKLGELDISTQQNAQESMGKIDTMINRVSSIRGQYGAMQNALEHIVNNLAVSDENLTQAESLIRDTDMAREMMNYTKQNILMQAAQSMLAQANQLQQGVLTLLQ